MVTHSAALREPTSPSAGRRDEIELYKDWGETLITGQTTLTTPPWDWGSR